MKKPDLGKSRPLGFAVLLSAALILGSCVTAPRVPPLSPDSLGVEYLPLEPGALVYMFADVDEARPILNRIGLGGISGGQAAEILDRTRYAALAVYPAASGRNVQAVAWGKYPSAGAGFFFTFSKDWKKRKSTTGKSYWYSGRDGLSVALNAGQAFVAMGVNPDPFAALPGKAGPEGFTQFRQGAALTLWLENPAAPLNRFLSDLEIPLQIPAEQLLISLYPVLPAESDSTNYESRLRIKTPSPSQARALVILFSMARLASGTAGTERGGAALLPILFAYPPVQDGQFLNIRTAPMDSDEIALLFDLFSVYSTQN